MLQKFSTQAFKQMQQICIVHTITFETLNRLFHTQMKFRCSGAPSFVGTHTSTLFYQPFSGILQWKLVLMLSGTEKCRLYAYFIVQFQCEVRYILKWLLRQHCALVRVQKAVVQQRRGHCARHWRTLHPALWKTWWSQQLVPAAHSRYAIDWQEKAWLETSVHWC